MSEPLYILGALRDKVETYLQAHDSTFTVDSRVRENAFNAMRHEALMKTIMNDPARFAQVLYDGIAFDNASVSRATGKAIGGIRHRFSIDVYWELDAAASDADAFEGASYGRYLETMGACNANKPGLLYALAEVLQLLHPDERLEDSNGDCITDHNGLTLTTNDGSNPVQVYTPVSADLSRMVALTDNRWAHFASIQILTN